MAPLTITSDNVLEEFYSTLPLSLVGLEVPVPKGGILQLIKS